MASLKGSKCMFNGSLPAVRKRLLSEPKLWLPLGGGKVHSCVSVLVLVTSLLAWRRIAKVDKRGYRTRKNCGGRVNQVNVVKEYSFPALPQLDERSASTRYQAQMCSFFLSFFSPVLVAFGLVPSWQWLTWLV